MGLCVSSQLLQEEASLMTAEHGHSKMLLGIFFLFFRCMKLYKKEKSDFLWCSQCSF